MMIEGLNFLLDVLKTAVYPYPELVSAGWPHICAATYMALLYFVYSLSFIGLHLMYQQWAIKEKG